MTGKESEGIPHITTIRQRLRNAEKSALAQGDIYVREEEFSDELPSEDYDVNFAHIRRMNAINHRLGEAGRSDILVDEADLLLLSLKVDDARRSTFAYGKNAVEHPHYQDYVRTGQITPEEAQQKWYYEQDSFIVQAMDRPVEGAWGKLFFHLNIDDDGEVLFNFDFDDTVAIWIISLDVNRVLYGYRTEVQPLEKMTKEEAAIAIHCIDIYTKHAPEAPQR